MVARAGRPCGREDAPDLDVPARGHGRPPRIFGPSIVPLLPSVKIQTVTLRSGRGPLAEGTCTPETPGSPGGGITCIRESRSPGNGEVHDRGPCAATVAYSAHSRGRHGVSAVHGRAGGPRGRRGVPDEARESDGPGGGGR